MTQCFMFDFTLSKEAMEFNDLVVRLQSWCKKYVFQLEKGEENGYLHWQGRVSLHKKVRLVELIKQDFLPKAHLSYTSKTTHEGNKFNYVMKAQTRVEGPWTELDYEEPPVLTRQLQKFMKANQHEWQLQLEKLCQLEDDRYITLIYDDKGNTGKSIMCEYLEYIRVAFEIPPLRNMEDIMQMCMCIKPKRCYLIDMPRAMKKDKLGEFYAGLESLKNGYVYDKRYAFKRRRFDRPQVMVFTNSLPQFELMSKDRWRIYQIQDYRLEDITKLAMEESTSRTKSKKSRRAS